MCFVLVGVQVNKNTLTHPSDSFLFLGIALEEQQFVCACVLVCVYEMTSTLTAYLSTLR